MFNPQSTYRLQFNKDFTFSHAHSLIDYFQKLGIKTIYASPIFKAVPGSLHGYDVVNPYEINPEIGSLTQLRRLIEKLKAAGIGWIQDIVPNHMAFHHTNVWLWDVLEKGSMSVYSDFFDVTWAGDFFQGRLMAPFLGDTLDQTIRDHSLKVVIFHNKLCLEYGDQYYPLNSRAYTEILQGHSAGSFKSFLQQIDDVHGTIDHVQYALRWHEILLQFSSLTGDSQSRKDIDSILHDVNEDAESLMRIVESQFYRLCKWDETDSQINYRRFFLVNGLICLNMQSSKVFTRYHEMIHQLVKEKLFQGLRVDHIDGLFDPNEYLTRLRSLCGLDCYIVVEKILEPHEELERSWRIQGSTGYEFLSAVNNLLTRTSAEPKFTSFYKSFGEDKKPVVQKIRDKKAFILQRYMQGELQNLQRFFIEHHEAFETKLIEEEIKAAIAEFLIEVPVYRYYGNTLPLTGMEREQIQQTIMRCVKREPALKEAFDILSSLILDEEKSGDRVGSLTFYQRCMQFSGPLMAKGVEDTLMYTFNRFVGHNEVGDSPEVFGLTTAEFHKQMFDRQQYWPLSLNATSTHDTKRGEDVRARLNVLPDMATRWMDVVTLWFKENKQYKTNEAPDVNDEYFIYQTLVGVFPNSEEDDFIDRVQQYLTKSLREAKRHSDWSAPDEQYESGVAEFIAAILSPDSKFMSTFRPFQALVSDFGVINSLTQVVLKMTCPGVPDVYQGTTGWDLTLVDPDNRRLVDYPEHERLLQDITSGGDASQFINKLWTTRNDGRIKLWMTHSLLAIRNQFEELFKSGHYIPSETEGRYAEHCLAFLRREKNTWMLVAIPLNVARIGKFTDDLLSLDWENTSIVIPPEAPLEWKSLLSTDAGNHDGQILVADIFKNVPVAVLSMVEKESARNAGVLLSISSLPSRFGVGDMGPEARQFAQFLSRGRQQIWQVLPMNATDHASAYSPYSSYSAIAGNISLISLDDLLSDGLLKAGLLEDRVIANRGVANFSKAEVLKLELLSIAFNNFKHGDQWNDFQKFVEEESDWLHDFAIFELLRDDYDESPWVNWPDEFKNRDSDALVKYADSHKESINRIKWMQYIFFKQWRGLRSYCNSMNIKLFGDLPFYVSYNSSDVWAHRDVFKLDESGAMIGIAGVPPDYFSESGQLWGMPVYRWDNLVSNDYNWFVKRIQKNLELFDMLRLDHFRAFVDFWEVPKGEVTAKLGEWKRGPGQQIFDFLKRAFGKLPFVAEDLGEVNQEVFDLRDTLGLPGMKVLQFAFGTDMPVSPHIPHHHDSNFIVYTGTHDNNTTRGWYRTDIDNVTKKHIDAYFGRKINAGNIANEMIRMAYASVATTAIIPMQDLLNLSERSRMNTPSTIAKNWIWRMRDQPDDDVAMFLRELSRTFNR